METCGMIILYQDKRAPAAFLPNYPALFLPSARQEGLFLMRERIFCTFQRTSIPVTAIMSKYNENGVFNSGYFHTFQKRDIYWHYYPARPSEIELTRR